MYTSRFDLRMVAALAVLTVGTASTTGCEIDPAEFRFGEQLTGLEFNLHSDKMGIHPNDDVLGDPNNPFRNTGIDFQSDTKFEILADGGHVGAFYAWATILAIAPNGEHQYFTAVSLENIFVNEEAPPDDLPIIQDMAIQGYQSLLDNFPDAIQFNEDGEPIGRFATLSYQAIVRLGAQPTGDWVLVLTPSGGEEAVRGSSVIDPQVPEEEDEDEEEEGDGP